MDFDRQVRVLAPLSLVWAEMNSLDDVLGKSPQLLSYVSTEGGHKAAVTTKLAWGPLRYAVEGTALVREAVPNTLLAYTITIPQLGLTYDADMTLSPGGPSECCLEYLGHLDLSHKMASRLRGLFSELVEDYVHTLVVRVKTRAEQRRLADERLLQ